MDESACQMNKCKYKCNVFRKKVQIKHNEKILLNLRKIIDFHVSR